MAAYRSGDFAAAEQAFLRVRKSAEPECYCGSLVYRAMAQRQLGRLEAAADSLKEATACMDLLLKNPAGKKWCDLAAARLALEEARALFSQPVQK